MRAGPDAGPTFWVVGVRDGNREFVRKGAIGALYHMSLKHLGDKGFTKLGLGNSAPFFNDGVFQYKRKLGMRLTGAFDARFLLGVPDYSQATGFLLANPFIFERDGSLYGVVFLDARRTSLDEDFYRRIYTDYYVEGMLYLFIVPLGGKREVTPVPPRLADRIHVCAPCEFFGQSP